MQDDTSNTLRKASGHERVDSLPSHDRAASFSQGDSEETPQREGEAQKWEEPPPGVQSPLGARGPADPERAGLVRDVPLGVHSAAEERVLRARQHLWPSI